MTVEEFTIMDGHIFERIKRLYRGYFWQGPGNEKSRQRNDENFKQQNVKTR